jgi:hypothetical protein
MATRKRRKPKRHYMRPRRSPHIVESRTTLDAGPVETWDEPYKARLGWGPAGGASFRGAVSRLLAASVARNKRVSTEHDAGSPRRQARFLGSVRTREPRPM